MYASVTADGSQGTKSFSGRWRWLLASTMEEAGQLQHGQRRDGPYCPRAREEQCGKLARCRPLLRRTSATVRRTWPKAWLAAAIARARLGGSQKREQARPRRRDRGARGSADDGAWRGGALSSAWERKEEGGAPAGDARQGAPWGNTERDEEVRERVASRRLIGGGV